MLEFAAVEQGGIVQNLGLMAQALGLGGFAHFAAHPWIWERELGFSMVDLPTSRVMGMNLLLRLGTRLLGRDLPMPTPVGLERGGDVLTGRSARRTTRACARPCSRSSRRSTASTGRSAPPTRRGRGEIRPPFARAPPVLDRRSRRLSRTAATCTSGTGGSRRRAGRSALRSPTGEARLDLDFYERFYTREALSDTQRAEG